MPNQQPIISDASGRRSFACSAAGLLAFIVNDREEILLLSNPKRNGKWEVVIGALDGSETILEGVLREIREEAGPAIRVRPLGTLHAYTFRYDDDVQYMISIAYLLAYEGGEVLAGDDMADSEIQWMSLAELESGEVDIIVPQAQSWLFRRALDLYRLWKDAADVMLQPHLDETTRNKYRT